MLEHSLGPDEGLADIIFSQCGSEGNLALRQDVEFLFPFHHSSFNNGS
jgi:hypothetical protein